MNRILVTGASGQLGHATILQLLKRRASADLIVQYTDTFLVSEATKQYVNPYQP